MRKKMSRVVLSLAILASASVADAKKNTKSAVKKLAADGTLYDAAKGGDLVTRGCTTEAVDYKNGKALKVVFGAYENWPKVVFSGPWDLTGYTGIEARITNIGKVNQKIFLQANNPTGAYINPWNMAVAYNGIAPGETLTLRIDFGYNNFRTQEKAYALDPSKVISILLGVDHPEGELVFRLESLRAVR